MAELGADAPRWHAEVGRACARLGIDVVIGVGELAEAYATAADGCEWHWAADVAEAAELLAARAAAGRLRAAQGLALGRRRAARRGRAVTHVLGAGVLATFLTVLCGGAFISFLRERSLGQNIREEGPAGHRVKQGTPTMGGLLILTMAAISFLIFTERSAQALTVLGVTVACAAIGFVDDYAKIANKRSLGLSGRYKLALLVPVSAVLGYVAHHEGLSTRLYLPLIDTHIDLGWGWYVARLPRARGLDQRRQPHRRARRPRRGHERDRVPGLHGARDDRLAALAHALRRRRLELPLRRPAG